MRLHPEMMQRRKELASIPLARSNIGWDRVFPYARDEQSECRNQLERVGIQPEAGNVYHGSPKLLDQLRQSIPTLADPLAVRVSSLRAYILTPVEVSSPQSVCLETSQRITLRILRK